MKHFVKALALGTTLAAFASIASATPITLTAGTNVTTYSGATGTPVNTGTIATSSGTISPGTFVGSVTETVFHSSSNVFNGSTPSCGALGCLTFELQIKSDGTSSDAIEHLTVGNGKTGGFAHFLTAVGYVNATGGNGSSPTDGAPVTVNETSTGTISFNFTDSAFPNSPGIVPGGQSDFVFIDTNDSAMIAPGFIAAIDSTSGTIGGVVPSAVTPEPSSLLMLGSGLVSAAGMLVRRRRMS